MTKERFIASAGTNPFEPWKNTGYKSRELKRQERQEKRALRPLNGGDSRKPERDSGNRPGGFPKSH